MPMTERLRADFGRYVASKVGLPNYQDGNELQKPELRLHGPDTSLLLNREIFHLQ